jgi:hypothetical protein
VEDYAGCQCISADQISRSTEITTDISDHIQRSRCLIADLTDSNPNVFYEVGFSLALGKDVILLLQEGSKLPLTFRAFDTYATPNRRFRIWLPALRGMSKAACALSQLIGPKMSGRTFRCSWVRRARSGGRAKWSYVIPSPRCLLTERPGTSDGRKTFPIRLALNSSHPWTIPVLRVGEFHERWSGMFLGSDQCHVQRPTG